MRIVTTLAVATVTAAALLGTAGVSAASAATPAPTASAAEAQAVYHRTFVVVNHSSYTLALVGYDGTHPDDQLPGPDSVVLPGKELPLNVTYRFFEQREVPVYFTVWDAEGNRVGDYRPVLRVDGGMGLCGVDVRVIPTEMSWLQPPVTTIGGVQFLELIDRAPGAPSFIPDR